MKRSMNRSLSVMAASFRQSFFLISLYTSIEKIATRLNKKRAAGVPRYAELPGGAFRSVDLTADGEDR
ncbi:MAG: hypothetical protein J6U75_08270, partial [Clostridia bacterium]|nr:hypothetical protein [Clostridia bacterium]